MNGSLILSSGTVATVPNSYSIIGQRDFNGDGNADLLWRDTGGNLYMWFMNGLTTSSSARLGNVPITWTVKGTGDMNGDGKGDLLWQDGAGDVAIWFMNGSTVSSTASLGTVAPASGWSIVWATTGEILWRNSSGDLALWQVNGSTVQSTGLGNVPNNWVVQGMGDFDLATADREQHGVDRAGDPCGGLEVRLVLDAVPAGADPGRSWRAFGLLDPGRLGQADSVVAEGALRA